LANGAAVSTVDAKKVVDELKTDWEQFKTAHDKEAEELKKLGHTTSETLEEQKKINKRLDEIEIKAQRARVAAGVKQVDEEAAEQKERDSFETKAFSRYVRRGRMALKPEEVKALAINWDRTDDEEVKALETDADVEGGAFVPHQLANRIIRKLILVSNFRRLAAVETISTNALEIPAEGAQNFAAGWVGERVSRTTTQTAQVRLERIPVHEMYAMPNVSQTQLDDSAFDIESWISDRVATIMAQLEGQAFLAGTGATQPEGVVGNSKIPSTQQLSIAAANFPNGGATGGSDMLITAWATLPTFYATQASWILNRATLGVVRKFKDNNNQYLWQPGGFSGPAMAAGFPATILGLPYEEMPDMQSVASGNVPIMLGAFKLGYQIVDRLGVRVLRDNLTQKPFVLLYTTRRVGGQVVLGEALLQIKTT
jgi:HK97 family phage major capsid protein